MPAPTKSLLHVGASCLTMLAKRRLRDPRAALRAQTAAFHARLSALAGTAYGRDHGLTRGEAYASFRDRVPIGTAATLAPYLARLRAGESGVLAAGGCSLYATTAGTTGGEPHLVPANEPMLHHLRRAGREVLLHYTTRVGHAGVMQGRHMLLAGPPVLHAVSPPGTFQVFAGGLGAVAALNLPAWHEKHVYEPGPRLPPQAGADSGTAALLEQAPNRDLSLLAGRPDHLLRFAESVLQRAVLTRGRLPDLQALWPNLECIVHGGLYLAPYLDELKALVGPDVRFHEVYYTAEAFIAAQDAEAADGLRLLAGLGVFFEFLPLESFDPLAPAGAKALPLAEVRTGVDYALLLTTPGGLCRHLVGDVVRFTSTTPPRLLPVGRVPTIRGADLSLAGERDLTDALAGVCHRHGWRLAQFHVAPFAPRGAERADPRSRHEWWIELHPVTMRTPTGPAMAIELDQELQRLSAAYRSRRRQGELEAPLVRLVMPGVFEQWLRNSGRWGEQNKVPVSRDDRAVADPLAQLARFSGD